MGGCGGRHLIFGPILDLVVGLPIARMLVTMRVCYRRCFGLGLERQWIGGEESKCIGDEGSSKVLFWARELNHSILGGGVLSSVSQFVSLVMIALSPTIPSS